MGQVAAGYHAQHIAVLNHRQVPDALARNDGHGFVQGGLGEIPVLDFDHTLGGKIGVINFIKPALQFLENSVQGGDNTRRSFTLTNPFFFNALTIERSITSVAGQPEYVGVMPTSGPGMRT